MKIIDIVKFNDGYAFVLDESPTMVYHEEMVKDNYTGRMKKMLVGKNDAGMMDFFTYGNELPYAKAFAGREFEILMGDGSKRTIKDVWWDGGSTSWGEAHGVKLVDFPHNTFERLVDCFVFFSGTARRDVIEKLLDDFHKENPDHEPCKYEDYRKYCREVKEETYVLCPKCRNCFPGVEHVGEVCGKCGKDNLIRLKDFDPFHRK